jgi:uncharacterized membrane protein YozB (DUF420 family)
MTAATGRTGGSGKAGAALWIVLVLALGVGLFSYRYLLPVAPVGAPGPLANAFTRYGVLAVHAGFAATALVIGPLQFFAAIRTRHPRWHRRIGTAYVTCCLVGGVAGFLLALGSTEGPVATAGFGSLALAWMAATGNAWRLARRRDFVSHRRWMIRSYALTFAAVTLRLYLPLIPLTPLGFDWGYRAISFLCWIPNLIVAELWLRRPEFRTSPPIAAPSQTPG